MQKFAHPLLPLLPPPTSRRNTFSFTPFLLSTQHCIFPRSYAANQNNNNNIVSIFVYWYSKSCFKFCPESYLVSYFDLPLRFTNSFCRQQTWPSKTYIYVQREKEKVYLSIYMCFFVCLFVYLFVCHYNPIVSSFANRRLSENCTSLILKHLPGSSLISLVCGMNCVHTSS